MGRPRRPDRAQARNADDNEVRSETLRTTFRAGSWATNEIRPESRRSRAGRGGDRQSRTGNHPRNRRARSVRAPARPSVVRRGREAEASSSPAPVVVAAVMLSGDKRRGGRASSEVASHFRLREGEACAAKRADRETLAVARLHGPALRRGTSPVSARGGSSSPHVVQPSRGLRANNSR